MCYVDHILDPTTVKINTAKKYSQACVDHILNPATVKINTAKI